MKQFLNSVQFDGKDYLMQSQKLIHICDEFETPFYTTKELTLQNKYGMHVRPAGLFAKVASRFDADVEVEKDGNSVSGKSIMALMTLEATCGTVLKVTASGPQAAEVLEELEALVARKFDIPDEQ